MMRIGPGPRRHFARLAVRARPAATGWLHSAVVALAMAGCVDSQPAESELRAASTVGDVTGASCTTAVVIGLSKQIADEIGCQHPGSLVPFDGSANLTITSNAVLQYLEADAKADLERVAQNQPLQVNSAFRTIAQQYLLYRWAQQGRCGIAIAAAVGNSNHESGRAVDLANWPAAVGAMAGRNWSHDVPGDDVHFDHVTSTDIRGEDIFAFQTLWNRNHPGDPIAVDGGYGPATEARLVQAPATGFPIGPSCGNHNHVANVVSVVGPDRAPPQTRVHYTVTIKNDGDVAWPATTALQLATGTTSPLHDSSWLSPTTITTLGAVVAAGSEVKLELDVTTPAATVDTAVAQPLVLADGATRFGAIDLAVTVVPDMTQPTSGDGSEQPTTTGGCAAGGGAGAGWLVAAVALGLARRRRRAR